MHERALQPAPGWTINWPERAPGFRNLPIDEGVRATLRFDEGREASWIPTPITDTARAASERCFLFFFRWNRGGSSVVRARAHRPDICLPAAGWKQQGDGQIRNFHVGDNLELPFRQVDFMNTNGATSAHTFFILQEDLRTNESRVDLRLREGLQPEWSLPARFRAVKNGVRNMGQQVVEFIIVSSHPESPESGAEEVGRLLPGLIRPAR